MSVKISGNVSIGALAGPSSLNLSDLHDVSITNPITGQYLRYDGAVALWENAFINQDVFNDLSTTMSGVNGISFTTNSGALTYTFSLTQTGVTASTYNNVTVDAYGRITAGTNATYLTGNQTITISGDATGSGSIAIPLTLSPSGVTAGQYTKVTVNAKGLVTLGTQLASLDVTTALGFTPYNATNPAGYISGNQTITISGDATGTGTTAIAVTLPIIATAGTYKSVTVNAKGQVTAGTNPTTLAGYGITDALPLTGGTMTGDITMSGISTVTGVPTPINSLDAVNKDYVDSLINGLLWKSPVNAATTANVALTGLQTVDGVALVAADRILVKNQTNNTENGIYVVAAGAWVRGVNADSPAELNGAAVFVEGGTVNAGTQWGQTATVVTIGVSPITWTQVGATTTYTGGNGIAVLGTVINNTGILSVVGTANQIVASTVAGNVTLSLPANISGLTSISATTITGTISGNAATATTATNVAGGAAGSVPYQSAASTTAMLAAGTTSQVLISGTTPSWTNTPTLTGTNFTGIPNAGLTNSSITLGTTSVALGGTSTTLTGLTSVTSTTFVGSLNGNALSATTSGAATNIIGGAAGNIHYQSAAGVTAFVVNAAGVLQAASAGAVPTWTTTPTLTGTNITGIPNAGLTNSSITIGTTAIALGASSLTLAGLTTVTSGVFNATSSAKLKKGIKKLGKEYVDKFSQLVPREFDWNKKDSRNGKHDFGFIAEEVYRVYPEVVGTDNEGNPTGVDYGKLTTILAAKIKSQEDIINDLVQQMSIIMEKLNGR